MADACRRSKNFEDPEIGRARNVQPKEKVESVCVRERKKKGGVEKGVIIFYW